MFHVEHSFIRYEIVPRGTLRGNMIDTVIFDFNGTLYFDKDLNEESWRIIYKEILGDDKNFDNELETILGTKTDSNIDDFFKRRGQNVSRKILNEYSLKKESLYQDLAKKKNRNCLAAGASELLDYLKENNIQTFLATASIKYNVDFYLEYVGLKKWFNYSRIAYDDGINKNKKEMYLKAISLADTNINNILAFDDTYNSIKAGIEAGINKVIRINPHNYKHLDNKCIIDELNDYTKLDYSIFKK